MLNEHKAPIESADARKWASEVKDAMRFVWHHYSSRALGHDEIRPVSGAPDDWIGIGVMVTDSLDTLWIMNLRKEFEEGLKWIREMVVADEAKDQYVSSFEYNIRVIGGLLGIRNVRYLRTKLLLFVMKFTN